MKRIVSVSAILMAFAMAGALGTFLNVFTTTYKIGAKSPLAAKKCMICHTSKMGGALNAYGADLKKLLGNSKMMTPAILRKAESLDSDKDGMKNGAEIKAGRMPGVKG